MQKYTMTVEAVEIKLKNLDEIEERLEEFEYQIDEVEEVIYMPDVTGELQPVAVFGDYLVYLKGHDDIGDTLAFYESNQFKSTFRPVTTI